MRACGLAVLVLAAACAPPTADSPRWQELTRPHAEGNLDALVERWNAARDERRFAAVDGELVIELPLDLAGWSGDAERGRWTRAAPAAATASLPEAIELVVDGRALPLPTRAVPGAALHAGRLVLALPPGTPAPSDALLRGRFLRRNGSWSAFDDHQRVREEALDVWPGERVELECDVPPDSVLRFFPRASPLWGPVAATFRVFGDGALLHESIVSAESLRSAAMAEVPLPAGPRVRLAFEVEGPPAATALARATIGPAATGAPGARPWSGAKGDVVVFMADTFRADLLAAWGGEPDRVPALDALAARSRRFLAARSASTWTLPAHASLFTGVWPPQHGAERLSAAFPHELATLAELFADAGYRTAAVTDGVFVSSRYGMERGFEVFRECDGTETWSLARTLARAEELARADDGRPLFLFVHTYRTHAPYRTGPEEDRSRYRELRGLGWVEVRGGGKPGSEEVERARPMLDEVRSLYRAGARGLDLEFGPWFARLEDLGLFRDGVFVFTSDHGEEFLEHGGLMHSGAAHEEVARVPLFLFGGGIEPGDVRLGASLVDIAPTLARRCGIPPPPLWVGADLLGMDRERTLFVCTRNVDQQLLGVVHGPFKLLAEASPEVDLPRDVRAAFDLAADPLEQTDVHGAASWPDDLARAARDPWEAARAPLLPAETVRMDPRVLEEMRELGYGE